MTIEPETHMLRTTPAFTMPAEWTAHRATWLAWPLDPAMWGGDLSGVRAEVGGLISAICNSSDTLAAADARPAEVVELLVGDEQGEAAARAELDGLAVRYHHQPFGDLWLRDTAPLFVVTGDRGLAAARFRFNGWGGKYLFPDDLAVSQAIAARARVGSRVFDLVLEGGAVDVDGQGTCITTRQCLLNANRNPTLDARAIEQILGEALGVEQVVWLERGLLRDHTDGHVDNVARFVAPGVVACMAAEETTDPNRAVLADIVAALRECRDARGRKLELVVVPSPGKILDDGGEPLPASYLNFYIANASVVVPIYGSAYDQRAVDTIAACFPDRRTIALPAHHLLAEGGAFHCITQQEPSVVTS